MTSHFGWVALSQAVPGVNKAELDYKKIEATVGPLVAGKLTCLDTQGDLMIHPSFVPRVLEILGLTDKVDKEYLSVLATRHLCQMMMVGLEDSGTSRKLAILSDTLQRKDLPDDIRRAVVFEQFVMERAVALLK